MSYKSRFIYIDDNGDLQEGMSGGIFITDIQPASGGIVQNTYKNNIIGKNIIELCKSDDNSIIVTVEWDGVAYDWNGTVTINGVSITNGQLISANSRRFVGSATIQVDSNITEIIALHEFGATSKCVFEFQGNGPIITDVRYVNGYPGTQTEVKENDVFDLEITFDPNSSVPSIIDIIDYGSMKSSTHNNIVLDNNHKVVITGIIDSTSDNVQLLPARVRSRNSFGTPGNYKNTDDNGNNEGINLIKCNDRMPSFVDNGTTFPVNQLAFKGNENGSKDVTVAYFTTVVYSSPTGEFTISNPNTYESSKSITCTNPGVYNDNLTNFSITAHRAENDTYATFNTNIEVADIAPIITLTQPYVRLRSSSSGINYTITAISNQNISNNIQMDVNIPVSGTWQGISWNGSSKIKTRDIRITDNDQKGEGDWSFITTPTNNAGIPAQISGKERVGGFVARTITIPAWPNREGNIGTVVVDTNKLICENLSKGGTAPNGGTIFTYKNNTANEENKYTITGSMDTWYNCDQNNAVSNTSGTAKVILEESV